MSAETHDAKELFQPSYFWGMSILTIFARFASLMKAVQPNACVTCTVWAHAKFGVHAKNSLHAHSLYIEGLMSTSDLILAVNIG